MIISLNSINQLISVMVKCGVLFEVRTEFLNITKTSCGFKGSDRVREALYHSVAFELLDNEAPKFSRRENAFASYLP
jgi:hypothetical protein